MKHLLVILSLIVANIAAYAQSQGSTNKYVVVDENVKNDIIGKIAKKYAKGKDMNELAYRELLREGFDTYFNNRKTHAAVYEQSFVDNLNKTIEAQDKQIEQLNPSSVQTQIDSARESEKAKWKAKNDTITNERDDLKGQLTKLQTELDKANSELTGLRQNAGIVENITSQLNETQGALNAAYSACRNGSLQFISDADGKKKAIEDYSSLMKMLKQPVPDEQQKKIALIESTCAAAKLYQKTQAELKRKYDKKAVDELVRQFPTIDRTNLTSQNATELASIKELLDKEPYVIKNFRNGILNGLRESGSIPDSEEAKRALTLITGKVKSFSGNDSNVEQNGYNKGYVYINEQLKTLRREITNCDKYRHEEKFKQLLDQIDRFLGDPVK